MFKSSICLVVLALCMHDTNAFHGSVLPLKNTQSFRTLVSSSIRCVGNSKSRSGLISLRAKDEGLQDVGAVAGGFSNKGEPPIQIRGFSLADLALFGGLAITIVSFYNYFTNGGSITSLGFIYGLPITLGGFALKYAEILPVPVEANESGEQIFEEKATEILRKVRADVTRHRYGDDAHLDTALEKLGLVTPGKGFPALQLLKIAKEKDELAFTMVFKSTDTPFKVWAEPARVRRYETFFGPGLNAEVVKGAGTLEGETVSGVTAGGAVSMAAPETAEAQPTVAEEKKVMEV